MVGAGYVSDDWVEYTSGTGGRCLLHHAQRVHKTAWQGRSPKDTLLDIQHRTVQTSCGTQQSEEGTVSKHLSEYN